MPKLFDGRAALVFGATLICGWAGAVSAAPQPAPLPDAELQAAPGNAKLRGTQISRVRYNGKAAFRLTDGRSEAIVVPELGRLMRFGLVGGANWLWNATPEPPNYGGWINWGGDKTWPSPQDRWGEMGSKKGWPPPPSWDGTPQTSKIILDKKYGPTLRTTSSVAPGSGTRISRDYRFEKGDLVVVQTAEKAEGAPIDMGIWSIAQLNFTDAVYLPMNPHSAFANNWKWLGDPLPEMKLRTLSPTLLEVRPGHYVPGKGPKVGTDSKIAALVAVQDGLALRLKANHPAGDYPDKSPVQLYVSGDQKADYMELELLSPLRKFKTGSRWTHTVHMKLIPLKYKNISDTALQAEVQKLLLAP